MTQEFRYNFYDNERGVDCYVNLPPDVLPDFLERLTAHMGHVTENKTSFEVEQRRIATRVTETVTENV